MQINRKKLFLVSNMYPSKKHIRYGIFVQNFEKALKNDYDVEKSVITKHTSAVAKLLAYLYLYYQILLLVFKAKKDDIIYVHFPLHVAPALWFIQLFKRDMVLNFHGSDLVFNSVLTKVLSVFLNSVVSKSFVVVPSNYYKSEIIKKYSIDPHVVFVYPSGGINTTVFYPKGMQKKDTFVLGFVSNFIETKGWKVLLLAVESLVKKKSIKNIELVMIGEGPDIEKIMFFIEKIDIKFKIISSVSQVELALIYNTFNLFIFPTYRESLGLVGLEAMACGTPIVASRVGGPMGYVENGVNGYLFNKKDSHDLEKKILQYYNLEEKEKEKIMINGMHTARLYDQRIVNKDLLSFLRKL